MKQLKIPYGEANFEKLRSNNFLYVDKTSHIELLEQVADYIFFIRPRRFGKSLFVKMLEYYYDIYTRDRFDKLFGDLYIGKNPTAEKNHYMILSLDFSGIVTNQGAARFYKSFDNYIVQTIEAFIYKYRDITGFDELPARYRQAEAAISFLISKFQNTKQKIYVLIDEYDNFANDLIKPIYSNNTEEELDYIKVIKSDSYVRTFYKTLKKLVKEYTSRVFMTGVSPIMLDDLASGFNITTNITIRKEFNEMLGFTDVEVIHILRQLDIDDSELNKIMKDLHFFYDGYLFSEESNTKLFNSDMFLYFLQHYQIDKRYPRQILDNNVKTDYRKIKTLAFNFKDERTIEELLEKDNISIMQLSDRFQLDEMYQSKDNFKSLLFYLGMLTIKGVNEVGELILTIPNYVSKKIYWEYFTKTLRETTELRTNELMKITASLRFYGDIRPFVEYVRQILEKLSNRDMQKFDEKYIKVVMFTLLDMDGFYLLQSEPEFRNGYADILLTRSRQFAQYIKYEWLIELKCIKEKDRKDLDKIRNKGIEQLKTYTESENIKKRFEDKEVKKALVCFIGKGKATVDEI
jgi:hypothetical protein